MFDEKRSWITKYMPFSAFLLMIRYKFAHRLSSTLREHFDDFFCILLKATGFPTILYNSNHVQTRERSVQGDQATIGGNAKVERRIRPKCSPGHRT